MPVGLNPSTQAAAVSRGSWLDSAPRAPSVGKKGATGNARGTQT